MLAALRTAKSSVAEQRWPDDGLGVARLAYQEGGKTDHAQRSEHQRCRRAEDPCGNGEREQQRAHPDDEQQCAQRIEAAPRTVLRDGGRNAPGQRQCDEHQRGAEPEHGRPPPPLDQDAADQRAERTADRRDGGIGAEHAHALALAVEGGGERRPAAQHQRDADSLQHAADEQQPVRWRKPAPHEARPRSPAGPAGRCVR